MWMINNGSTTPKAAMEEWAPKMQKVIDDVMTEATAQ
jgi:hypothetical protein